LTNSFIDTIRHDVKFKSKLHILIASSTIIRLLIACSLELGNDESYYRGYALHLQWNYFDHPPLVALLIRATTLIGLLNHELFFRLGSVLCAAVNTYLIYAIAKKIAGERSAWFAACLFTFSFYSSIIAGTFILPDAPQLVFWLLSIWFMILITAGNPSIRNWILLGVCMGCCIMSKVHGIFLWVGFGGYILFGRRDLLRTPYLYISLLITLVIISPIYFWNLSNHFITYTYHKSRFGIFSKKPDLDDLLQQVFGSIFYNNPVNYFVYVLTIISLWKRKIVFPAVSKLLLWLSLPLILILLFMSLFNDTLPHWSGPAYTCILILAAIWLDKKNMMRFPAPLIVSGILFLFVVVVGALAVNFLPFRIGSGDKKYLGKGDITLDMSGWKGFSGEFDSIYLSDARSGIMKPGATIISDYWFPAGHLDYYVARPHGINILAIGPLPDIHHYAWLNAYRKQLQKGDDAYFIYPSNYYGPPKSSLRGCFEKVEDSILCTQYRSGIPVRNFVIYRMHGSLPDRLQQLSYTVASLPK